MTKIPRLLLLLLSVTTGLVALLIGGMLFNQHTTQAFSALQPAEKLFDPFLTKPSKSPVLVGPIFPPKEQSIVPQVPTLTSTANPIPSQIKPTPEWMTFEGRNFDIIAGITAPFIAYFGLTKNKVNRQVILIWNYICLGLLINIVVNALFSVPSPIQKFAFDQPNIAILNFPFSWLPTFIVPIVLFGHLASIRQLLKHNTKKQTNEKTTKG